MSFKELFSNLKFNLFQKEYTLSFFSSPSRQDTAMGRMDGKIAHVSICQDMPPDTQEETFLHEVIHHIDEQLAIKLSEEQTTALSTGLYCFLKENKLIN